MCFDNIVLAGTRVEIDNFKSKINGVFKAKDLGLLTMVLWVKAYLAVRDRTQNEVGITQHDHVQEIAQASRNVGFSSCVDLDGGQTR